MGALLSLAEFEFCAAYHHIVSVVDKRLKYLLEIQSARTSVYQRYIVYAERRLHLSHLVELVQNHIGVCIALHLNDNAHALVVAEVMDACDAVQLLLVYQFRYIFNKECFVDIVGNLGHHDILMVGFLLNLSLGSYDYTSATGFKSVFHAVIAVDNAACGEIGSLDVLHQLGYRDFRIVYQRYRGVDAFSKIVGGNICSHTHGDTARTVDKQIGKPCGQYHRLAAGIVIVGLKVYRVAFYVAQHLFADTFEAHLGVTHRRRAVTVHRAEVSMSVDKCVAKRPWLGKTHHCAVDRRVSVRVIFTHNLTHAVRRLLVRVVRRITHLVHTEQHPAVHRLETVAHIRERTRHDYRHGVVDIRCSRSVYH